MSRKSSGVKRIVSWVGEKTKIVSTKEGLGMLGQARRKRLGDCDRSRQITKGVSASARDGASQPSLQGRRQRHQAQKSLSDTCLKQRATARTPVLTHDRRKAERAENGAISDSQTQDQSTFAARHSSAANSQPRTPQHSTVTTEARKRQRTGKYKASVLRGRRKGQTKMHKTGRRCLAYLWWCCCEQAARSCCELRGGRKKAKKI